MKKISHPFGYEYKKEFDEVKLIANFEGVSIYYGFKEKKNFLIIDSGTLIEFLDPIKEKSIIEEMVKIIEFDNLEELKKYIEDEYGRFGSISIRSKSKES